MITAGGFILGMILIGVGGLMVWKSNRLRQTVGDLATLIGYNWLDWPVIGVVAMLVGALIAFGILQTILGVVLGGFGGS